MAGNNVHPGKLIGNDFVLPEPGPQHIRTEIAEVKPSKPEQIQSSTVVMKKLKAILLANIFVAATCSLLIIGAGLSLYAWRVNEITKQRAAKLVYEANHNIKHDAPSTIKPSLSAIASYVVAPTLPRYLIIPALNVNARILSVGVDAKGVLSTPSNVYDAAWYNKSAQPGQIGAMLIDGHISSWTTRGIFYGLKTLHPGDAIDIQGGNGAVFTYQVVKTSIYDASSVDMTTAMASIIPGKPGLNLISCTGNVISGTSDFNKRIVVFAAQR